MDVPFIPFTMIRYGSRTYPEGDRPLLLKKLVSAAPLELK